MKIEPSGQSCGATIAGVNLTEPLAHETVEQLRAAWLEHHVLAFPEQSMTTQDLERFTQYFGPFGDDPFIQAIEGHPHVIAVQRAADETGPVFVGNVWHTDWSFQAKPPAGTCLLSITIPPCGGDTVFANQHMALERMPEALRKKLEGKFAVHSARYVYSKQGAYGDNEEAKKMSMTFHPSDEANAEQRHSIIRAHPETGRLGIFGCFGYMIGIEGLDDDHAAELLLELHAWQTRVEFQYRHQWQENMLVMWDNRSLLHAATGGYDGYDRLLHRTTIADTRF